MITKKITRNNIVDLVTGQDAVREKIDSLVYEAINRDDGINFKMLFRPVVDTFYKALEMCIVDILSDVNEGEEVDITLFSGLHIKAVMVPPKQKKNCLTGKMITTKRKIKPKIKFSRYFEEALMKGKSEIFED